MHSNKFIYFFLEHYISWKTIYIIYKLNCTFFNQQHFKTWRKKEKKIEEPQKRFPILAHLSRFVTSPQSSAKNSDRKFTTIAGLLGKLLPFFL